jgi:hypothetical protein
LSKDIISLGVFSTLSMAVIIGVFNWLDGHYALTSESALKQAEQSLSQYCSRQGIHVSDLQLIDASAPEEGQHGWQFKFKSPGGPSITVEVKDKLKPVL